MSYETHGLPEKPPVVALQGLAEGRRFWPTALIEELVDGGYYLVLLDNRDIGDSTIMEAAGAVDLVQLMTSGGSAKAPYTLVDMAADTVALMDHLSISAAHLVGYSLGGMIAQWVALQYPERAASLVPLMSTSGAPGLPVGEPQAMAALLALAQPCAEPPAPLARVEALWAAMQSAEPADGNAFCQLLLESGYRPEAVGRQLAAGLCAPPRHERLADILCPATVIHGTHDAMFPLEHGADLVSRLGNARFATLPGAGHALTAPVAAQVTESLLAHLTWAEEQLGVEQ